MSRVNWMNLATWAVLVVCLILAFGYGSIQYGRLKEAQKNTSEVTNKIGLQDIETEGLRKELKPVSKMLAYPNQKEQEDAEFLSQLRDLMDRSGVKQVQMDRKPIETLPTLSSKTATSSTTSSSATTDPGAADKAKLEPSIVNMPLGVRAISTNLVVQGPFLNIRHFLYQISTYRYHLRAINVNSLQIVTGGEKDYPKATMMLTRFVRPADPMAGLSPVPGSEPGAASGDKTGASMPPGTPNTPGMPGNPDSPTIPNRNATLRRASQTP